MSAKRAAASKPSGFGATKQIKQSTTRTKTASKSKPAARAPQKTPAPAKTSAKAVQAAISKKATPKVAAVKNVASKTKVAAKAVGATPKKPVAKAPAIKVVAKKAPVKATAPKAAAPKAAPKNAAPKAAPKNAAPKAAPKAPSDPVVESSVAKSKIAARKVTPAAPEKTSARKSAPSQRAPKPAPEPAAPKAAAPASTGKDKSMEETAKPAARAVVRIARGLRTPKTGAAAAAPQKDAPRPGASRRPGEPTHTPRRGGPKIEINPRLERSKHLVTEAPAADGAAPARPMSVAAKHRAAAEAVFARLTVPETKPAEAPAAAAEAPAALPYSARPADQGGGSYTMRISEHDSAVTALRLASNTQETLEAARNLADRFKLPPDQSLLLRVVALGDARLTKLALEELLELEDRGRVRPTPELKNVLGALQTSDPETREIRQLFLEKIGVAP